MKSTVKAVRKAWKAVVAWLRWLFTPGYASTLDEALRGLTQVRTNLERVSENAAERYREEQRLAAEHLAAATLAMEEGERAEAVANNLRGLLEESSAKERS